jgi:UDP-2-acetamido-3-amino-2,3-dideoxy-glucuronate N-acetyltransferase
MQNPKHVLYIEHGDLVSGTTAHEKKIMKSQPFIGLVGLGYWGKNLFRNLCEIGALHTACDCSPEIVSHYGKNVSGSSEMFPSHPRLSNSDPMHFTTSFEEVLKNPEIKAVAIATPAATHYELVRRSLMEGKDVFVEKPLALTVKEGRVLVEIAKREKRILMLGHILHYHPAVIRLKELISLGEIGKIQYIYSNRLNIGKLRTEENILWSFAPHDVSVILMLLEEEPVSVSAYGGDYLNKRIYDTTMTTLEFANGVKGHIFVSWLHPYKEQKLVVVGSKAMIVFDDVSKEKLFLYPHTIEWKDGKIPYAKRADSLILPVENGEPLKEELKHFIECVVQRKQPRTDGEEGLRVLTVLEAAEHSLKNGTLETGNTTTVPYPVSLPASSKFPSVHVHESAYVDENVIMGEGVRIWHFSHVLKNSVIGKRCVIGQNVVIGPDVRIGDGCKIQNNVSVYKGVILENDVFCGPSCVFTNVYNPRAFIERKREFRNTLVKKGATIGANATIVCGVTVGQYSVIGAGAVVKTNVPDYAVVAGVPAKRIGWACKCGTTLRFKDSRAVCTYCGNEYERGSDNYLIVEKEAN